MTRFVVLGHHGLGNLGDEAVVEALTSGLRKRFAEAEIVGLSMNPADTTSRLGIQCFGVRFGVGGARAMPQASVKSPEPVARPEWLRRLRARLRWLPRVAHALISLPARAAYLIAAQRWVAGADLLIVAGSNQLLDQFGGALGFPLTLLRWSLQARLAGAQVAYLSVGAGPLDARWSRRLIAWALAVADYVSVRDQHSAAIVAAIAPKRAIVIEPDLAFALPGRRMRLGALVASPPIVAINVMPVFDPRYWPRSDPAAYRTLIERFTAIARGLQAAGVQLRFFATQRYDVLAAQEVIASLREPVTIETPRTVAELLETVASADAVIATRFHGIVLSLVEAKPVLGVLYHPKSAEALREAGLGRYVAAIDSIDAAQSVQQLRELLDQRTEISARLARYAVQQSRRLDRQLDRVAELVEQRPALGVRSPR